MKCQPEVYVFLELLFFYDPMDVSNLISGSSAFYKSDFNIWKFLVHVLLPRLKRFEHYLASMGNARTDESQAGIKTSGRNINKLR